MWTAPVTYHSSSWELRARLHNVVIYLVNNKTCLTTTVFFIMAELYITTVTQLTVIHYKWCYYPFSIETLCPQPAAILLALWRDLYLAHVRPQKWDSGESISACVWLPSSQMLLRVRRSQTPTPFIKQPILCQSQGNITAREVYGLIASNRGRIRVWGCAA